MSELASASSILQQCIDDVENALAMSIEPESDTEAAFKVYQGLVIAHQVLGDVKNNLGHRIGESIGKAATMLDGRKVKRHAYYSRRNWDSDALVSAVMDSRLADPKTGELVDESEADRLRHVWPPKGYTASVAALRARNIQPDEFCEERFVRFNLEVR